MRRTMILVLGLAVALVGSALLVGPATAQLLGNRLPPKSDDHVLQDPFDAERQGGDTIGTSVPIPMLPYSGGGTTCGYEDDYDAACPYPDSTSPDVVYRYIVEGDIELTVDLCGSDYNTKVYILDNTLDVLACNDDFYFDEVCGQYVSRIGYAFITGGQIIYIVIDGNGGECGDYLLNVSEVESQGGGDTIATATPIPGLPYSATGGTCQFTDNYDAVCPYSGSTSPDVVYRLDIVEDTSLTIDLCGSGYDTKVYVVDAGLNVLACNDDFYFDDICGVYVSKIDGAFIGGGQTVYIVVDGYGGDCGQYIMDVSAEPFVGCDVVCPGGGVLEGEPPLVDGYNDEYNGGCNSPPTNPFQNIWGTGGHHVDFCGVSGWYLLNGNTYRDTDWFIVVLDGSGAGFIDCTIDAESGTYLFELGPQDCGTVGVLQLVQVIGGCNPQNMTVFGAPGDIVWLWVGPDVFTAPPGTPNEYPYVLTIDGLEDGITATESASWSEVKELYR